MRDKTPSLQELQAAIVETSAYDIPADEDDEEEEMPATTKIKMNNSTGGKLSRGWRQFLAFLQELPDLLRRIGDIVLNVLTVATVVVVVAGVSVVGDRLYLQYNDTGSSRFEAFLKERGYGEEAIAFRRQNEVCQDKTDALDYCIQASYLYKHPEIAIWPDKTKTANALPSAKINVPGG